MKKSRLSPDEILQALRQAEGGTVVGEICRKLGVTEATFFRWRKQYAGLDIGDLRDHGAPQPVLACEALVGDRLRAMQLIGPQPTARRRLGPSGLVDAARHRGRVGHARSGTEERRAHVRLGC